LIELLLGRLLVQRSRWPEAEQLLLHAHGVYTFLFEPGSTFVIGAKGGLVELYEASGRPGMAED
jgi:hypothetical protein